MNKLKGAKYFTKLDIRWGYNNVQIKEGDGWKAAFLTNRGLFEPLVMFFGLTNLPATFQTMMNELLQDLINTRKVLVYINDILIFTNNLDEHHKLICQVLSILSANKLYLKPEKCEFEKQQIEFLGLIVSEGKVEMDPIKVSGTRKWSTPNNKKELQQFLGFCNFYRRFVKDYSKIAKPMTQLTRNDAWKWGTEQQTAFDTLKETIMTAPCLCIPEDEGQFRIEADASEGVIIAVISQWLEDKWHPVTFHSKALSPTERNYEIYNKEMFTIMEVLTEWRHLLLGARQTFEIWTDHQNLQYLRQPQKLNRRQAHWVTELVDYDYTLHHKLGKQNQRADLLSRRPDHDMGQKDNENVVMLAPMTFRVLEAIVTHDPLEYLPELKDPLQKLDPSAKQALEGKDKKWKESDGLIFYDNCIYVPRNYKLRKR